MEDIEIWRGCQEHEIYKLFVIDYFYSPPQSIKRIKEDEVNFEREFLKVIFFMFLRNVYQTKVSDKNGACDILQFFTANLSLHLYTGRIQCEVLTTLPFCFSWIKKFLGQQSKI